MIDDLRYKNAERCNMRECRANRQSSIVYRQQKNAADFEGS